MFIWHLVNWTTGCAKVDVENNQLDIHPIPDFQLIPLLKLPDPQLNKHLAGIPGSS